MIVIYIATMMCMVHWCFTPGLSFLIHRGYIKYLTQRKQQEKGRDNFRDNVGRICSDGPEMKCDALLQAVIANGSMNVCALHTAHH